MTGSRLLLTLAIGIAAMCIAIAMVTGDEHVVIRWTARSSLVLFVLAYVARPATQLWPRALTKRLLRERKWLGDGFAVSHLAHFIAIAVMASRDWDGFIATSGASRVIATIVFVWIFAMGITSIDVVRKRMPRRAWHRLHLFGMHAIWITFTTTYVGRLGQSLAWAVPVLVLAAAAGIRAAAWLRARGEARARASVAA